jgi:hypothetical protein
MGRTVDVCGSVMRGRAGTYRSCRLETTQSTHGPRCTFSLSLRGISLQRPQWAARWNVHAADTENSRCRCCNCDCSRWHANCGLVVALAKVVNWRTARTALDRAAILVCGGFAESKTWELAGAWEHCSWL